MASIRIKDGRFYIRGRDRHGRLKEFAVPARNKTEAKARAAAWQYREDSIRRGFDVEAEPMTLQELFELYEPQAKGMASHASALGRIKNHILPTLGGRLLGQIRPLDIQALLTKKAATLSPQTVDHLRVHLAALYTFAIRNKIAKESPVKLVPRVYIPDPEPKALKPEQVARVLDSINGAHRLLVAAAAFTAMRKGELLGLTWDRVDLEHRSIRVAKSYNNPTKSKKQRSVPIPLALTGMLQAAKDKSTSAFVFPGPDGEMRGPDFDAAAIFRTALTAAGLIQHWEQSCVTRGRRKGCGPAGRTKTGEPAPCPKCGRALTARPVPIEVRFKDLRSTYITQLVEATGDVRSGQMVAGHSESKTTGRHYVARSDPHLLSQVDRAFGSPHSFPTTQANSGDENQQQAKTAEQQSPTKPKTTDHE